jgi:Mechanosensitive ion channel, beta-domain
MNLGAIGDFWDSNDDWISAAITMALAFALAYVVDRAFQRRAGKLAAAMNRGQVSPETATRLRFVRRVVGVVAAAIVGFAARQTLANFVAGVMLAVTQPLRVGDWVTFEDHYGVVEDVRLNFTILRTTGEQRVVIPNERLAAGILQNDTLTAAVVDLGVDVWIPAAADAERAMEVLREEAGGSVAIAEVAPWGLRLAVGGDRVPPPERAGREAELRARCHARLRAEGLLEGFAAPDRS